MIKFYDKRYERGNLNIESKHQKNSTILDTEVPQMNRSIDGQIILKSRRTHLLASSIGRCRHHTADELAGSE